jgi:predicted nucleic acid-binding protein
MKTYFDSGILLKLYTSEPASAAVREFVVERGEALRITDLHHTECVTALRLKQFRGEDQESQVSAALGLIEADLRSGVLRIVAVDWNEAWRKTRELSERHAAATGCRTLDSLHVAAARLLGAKEFATSDRRQIALAAKIGLQVVDPTE